MSDNSVVIVGTVPIAQVRLPKRSAYADLLEAMIEASGNGLATVFRAPARSKLQVQQGLWQRASQMGYRATTTAASDETGELLYTAYVSPRAAAQSQSSRAGVGPSRRATQVSHYDVAAIREMRAKGAGVREIARQIGSAPSTVSRILRSAGDAAEPDLPLAFGLV